MKEIEGIFKMVVVLVILAGVSYLAYIWIKKMNMKDVLNLAKDDAINSKGGAIIVSTVPVAKRAQAQQDLKSYDLQTPAEMIYKAKGLFSDDPDNVLYAFGMLKNKVHLVTMSDYFKRAYGKELFSYLKDFLNASELSDVDAIVKKLPAY